MGLRNRLFGHDVTCDWVEDLPGEIEAASDQQNFHSVAWLMVGCSSTSAGQLALRDGHLEFIDVDGEVHVRTPRCEIESAWSPWYYFGGGLKLRMRGRTYRIHVRITQRPAGGARRLAENLWFGGRPRSTVAGCQNLSRVRARTHAHQAMARALHQVNLKTGLHLRDHGIRRSMEFNGLRKIVLAATLRNTALSRNFHEYQAAGFEATAAVDAASASPGLDHNYVHCGQSNINRTRKRGKIDVDSGPRSRARCSTHLYVAASVGPVPAGATTGGLGAIPFNEALGAGLPTPPWV